MLSVSDFANQSYTDYERFTYNDASVVAGVKGRVYFNIKSTFPCTRIRISLSSDLAIEVPGAAGVAQPYTQQPILVYSNMVDNYIGCFCVNYKTSINTDPGGTNNYLYLFGETLVPVSGLVYYARNKFYLDGQYYLDFFNLDGTKVNNNNIAGTYSLAIEYFA